jgi:O-antigen/teichoic acid export membrane protein
MDRPPLRVVAARPRGDDLRHDGQPKGPERWFHLDDVRSELGTRTVRSGGFALTGRAAQVVLQLGSFLVLARILTPDDFGVIGMVLPFAILTNSIANIGLQTTIIHRETITHDDASALFWAAARINLLLAGGMALLGTLLASLFDEPRVTLVAVAWATIIYYASLGAVHEATLKRQLRFDIVLSLHFVWLAVGTAVGIVLALRGARHWSLVAQTAVLEVGRCTSVWIVCGWRPGRGRNAAPGTLRALRRYWRDLAVFRMLAWCGDHPDRIIVGHVGGAAVLGLYESARRWAWYPFIELFLSLSDVAVATLSRVREDTARYRAAVLNGITAFLALTMPATAFLFVEAGTVVEALLGARWIGAVPFVRLMCIAAFFGALSRITQWLYLSRGDTERQVRWAALTTACMAVAVLIGASGGALGVAWAFTAINVLLAVPALAFCVRDSAVSTTDTLLAASRPAAVAVAAAAILALVRPLLHGSVPLLDLIASGMMFTSAYLAGWLVVPGGRDTVWEVGRLLRERRRGALSGGTPRVSGST